MKVGFIGLGNMGGAMAANILKAGFSLTVHDLRPEAATQLLEGGAQWADTPQGVAAACEVVFTSLPGPPEVEAVALGEDGILSGINGDAVYIDASTSSPSLIRRIHTLFAERGAHVMDAPVSGGPTGARTGQLAVMVGGDRSIFERCKPVLDAIGDQVTLTGDVGCGSICKLMHNCIGYALVTVAAECLTLGVKAGVQPKALWEAICNGAVGRGAMIGRTLAETYLQGRFDPPTFALNLAYKDVDLAVSLGKEYGVPMGLANLTLQEMITALNRGWGERDSRIIMLLQEERAGNVQVRVPGLQHP